MKHEPFHYQTVAALTETAEAVHAFLPLSDDLGPLFTPLQLDRWQAANRFAIEPMEGSDGTEDGAPGELTVRRYRRFAAGGPGVIWFEAVATLPEVRASRHQLWLTPDNVDGFKRLLDDIRETSLRENGYGPLIVCQVTNSGRYAKPTGTPAPRIAYHSPALEDQPLPDSCIVTDDDLRRYEEAYAHTVRLCVSAGFDGIDVKACHRYLASELLSAYTRPGPYGGSYENRTRFLKNCCRAARSAAGTKAFLTSRLNIYDGFAWPEGFGVTEGQGLAPDLTEPIRLVRELRDEFGMPLVNITMGNPYRNPHVNRPYDHGNYVPDEHPLEGIGRMMSGVSAVQHAIPDLPILGSAFSYVRQYAGMLAAGMVAGGHCAMAGFGRMAFACPAFIHELRDTGTIDPKHACVTCGGCASLLRAGRPAGCVVRDREVYQL